MSRKGPVVVKGKLDFVEDFFVDVWFALLASQIKSLKLLFSKFIATSQDFRTTVILG